MISADTIWGLAVAGFIQAAAIIFYYGRLTQKVDELSKKLNNGWTCKYHTGVCTDIAKLEGEMLGKITNPLHREAGG